MGDALDIEWETISPAPRPQAESAEAILRSVLSACEGLKALLQSAAVADEPVLLLVNDAERSTQTRPVLEVLGELVSGMGKQSRDTRRSLPVSDPARTEDRAGHQDRHARRRGLSKCVRVSQRGLFHRR